MTRAVFAVLACCFLVLGGGSRCLAQCTAVQYQVDLNTPVCVPENTDFTITLSGSQHSITISSTGSIGHIHSPGRPRGPQSSLESGRMPLRGRQTGQA